MEKSRAMEEIDIDQLLKEEEKLKKFPTSSAALIEFECDNWKCVKFELAQLIWQRKGEEKCKKKKEKNGKKEGKK